MAGCHIVHPLVAWTAGGNHRRFHASFANVVKPGVPPICFSCHKKQPVGSKRFREIQVNIQRELGHGHPKQRCAFTLS